MRRAGLSKDELVERSEHSTPHVLALFEQSDPNPTLRLYLELVHKAGARFHGVINNDPVQVVLRLKEIMARENITTVSALAKVAGVNRSQLSTLLNDANPNPTLAVFDRLVVALGAEQDFVLVSYIDKAVAHAITVGTAEVQAVKREVRARHLHSVPEPAHARPSGEAEQAAAAARDQAVQAKMDDVLARLFRLQQANVELEQQHADDAAEIVRLNAANATLEQLRAEDAAEIARLTQANRSLERLRAEDAAEIARLNAADDWSLGKKILFGLGCALTGAGVARLAMHGRR